MSETPEQRSLTMRAVHSRNTAPEMVVRRFLHSAGLRYRIHDRSLPGTPDLVFPSRRIALFVHGCFWHQHSSCKAADRPKSRPDYWNRKLDGNIARDKARQQALCALGWKAIVIWECETSNWEKIMQLEQLIRSMPKIVI
jgi:DNA mismatch endonuclease (patch repair protein)